MIPPFDQVETLVGSSNVPSSRTLPFLIIACAVNRLLRSGFCFCLHAYIHFSFFERSDSLFHEPDGFYIWISTSLFYACSRSLMLLVGISKVPLNLIACMDLTYTLSSGQWYLIPHTPLLSQKAFNIRREEYHPRKQETPPKKKNQTRRIASLLVIHSVLHLGLSFSASGIDLGSARQYIDYIQADHNVFYSVQFCLMCTTFAFLRFPSRGFR